MKSLAIALLLALPLAAQQLAPPVASGDAESAAPASMRIALARSEMKAEIRLTKAGERAWEAQIRAAARVKAAREHLDAVRAKIRARLAQAGK